MQERLRLADRLWRARRYALNLSASFVDATFRERFGMKLEDGHFRYLGDVVTITGGGTPSRARPDYFRGSIRG